MGSILTIAIIILCIILTGVILIQNPKGGGLSSAFGPANQFGGVKQTTDMIEKITWGLAVAIVVLSMFSSTMSTTATVQTQQGGDVKQGQQQGGGQQGGGQQGGGQQGGGQGGQ